VSLNDKGKPVVIESLNRHLDETVRYRGKNVKRKHIIQHEAHKMANILLGEDGGKKRGWLDITEF
jgi:CRISPR-associated protein Cas1